MEIINITDEIIEVNVTEAIVNVVSQTGAYPLPSNVFSVFGRVGNVVGEAGDYNTDLVGEGLINKYYTDARSRAAISENITGMEYSSASGVFSLASGYVIPTQAMLDAKVPYTGATGNVALGEYQLGAGQVVFDQTPTGAAGVGVLRWNDSDGTLDLGLKGGAVTLQIGQEQLKRVVNKSGISLAEAAYQVVKIQGAQGQRLAVELAQASNDLNSATTLGIVTETIALNQEGFITTSGEVRNINTTGSLQGETWADGDVLYLSPSVAGKITNIKPSAPNHMVIVGYVEYAHSQNGKIFVKVDNGYELDELHNVKITDPANNQSLIYDSTDGVWKNESIDSALGYTPVPTTRTISTTAPLTGGGDLSANRTLSMPAATTSASGYLTSTDWNTFNGKQPLIAAGTTAQYYRGDKTFQTLDTLAVPENTNLYYTAARFNTAFSGKTTTDLAEGTNLYFTNARAQSAISGTLPISVISGVVSISQASGSSNGYLSSTDWNTFNSKQAALNGTGFVKISGTTISYDNSTYLTTIEGITAGGELSGTYASPSLVNSAVTGKILSGVNITGGTISDTDSILTAFGKLQNQVNGLIGGSIYKGTWNASTNTPTLASGVGAKGNYYIVSVAGTTNIDGITDWNVGDWIIYDGTAWQQVDNTDAVVSVNGETGAVSLTTSNIAEGTNLYFTNARSIASTLTGYTSGAGTITSSDTILSAIQKLNGNVSGLVTGVSSVFGRTGAVTAQSGDYTTTQVTEGTNLYYTEARVSANTDVSANTAARHNAVTIGTANGLSLSTQVLSLAAANGSTTGALTSTDWNTFNNKQAALNGTGFVKISGTTISYDNSTYLTTSTAASTYLPLTGGTLTGALSGTSATFSGQVTTSTSRINGRIFTTSDASFGDMLSTTGVLAMSYDASGQHGYITSRNYTTSTNTPLTFTASAFNFSTGAATFSSSVTANDKINNNADQGAFRLYNSAATFAGGIGTGAWVEGTATTDIAIYSANNLKFYSGNSSTAKLTIASTGAATFSSSVTSAGSIIAAGSLTVGNNAGGSTNALYLAGSDAAHKIWSSGGGGNNMYFDEYAYDGVHGFFWRNSEMSYSTMMSLTKNGLGIGTSSPSWKLDVRGTGMFNGNLQLDIGELNTPKSLLFNANSTTGGSYGDIIWYNVQWDGNARGSIRVEGDGALSNGRMIFSTGSSGSNATEKMRINSEGYVLMGTTGNSFNSRLVLYSSVSYALHCIRTGTGSEGQVVFSNGNGAVGSIFTSGSATFYNATSDYRLKQDLKDYNGLDLISKIKTYDYEWKSDKTRMYGVIAHELSEVIPYAVFGKKDAEEMQQVDYSKIVPVLVKAIQELSNKILSLESK